MITGMDLIIGDRGKMGITSFFLNLPIGSVMIRDPIPDGELMPEELKNGEAIYAHIPMELSLIHI